MYVKLSPQVAGALLSMRRIMERDQPALWEKVRKTTAAEVCGHESDPSVTFEEIIKDIEGQLAERSTKTGDFIDEIIRIILAPWTRNVLAGDALRKLRHLLLLPGELRTWAAAIEKGVACNVCEKRIRRGEVTSFHTSEGGELLLVCPRCALPTRVACRTCDISVPLSEKVTNIISGAVTHAECPQCKTARLDENKKAVVPAPANVNEPVPAEAVGQGGLGFWGGPQGEIGAWRQFNADQELAAGGRDIEAAIGERLRANLPNVIAPIRRLNRVR